MDQQTLDAEPHNTSRPVDPPEPSATSLSLGSVANPRRTRLTSMSDLTAPAPIGQRD